MNSIVELLTPKVIPVDEVLDPASAEEIAVAESRLGIALPVELRDIQISFGRCMFCGEALVDIPGTEPLGIFTLFGCKGDVGNLVSDFEAHDEMQHNGLVPFADDCFNNRFVWRSTQGDVLFLDYSGERRAIVVASSLEEFVRRIHIVPS